MNKTVTHGSLFAGIGGFDLGFQWAGIKTLWDVEIDSYCQKVLRKNFPDAEILSDVKEVGKHNLAPVDVISGGFPCQPWSVAGKQGGTEDDRNLWPEMFRVIGELHPRWVVAENVPNLDAMGYLDVAIDDLESIGYEVRPVEIPAAGVGAPHLRKRIWIVAYAGGNRREGGEYSIDGQGTPSVRRRPADEDSNVPDSESPRRREDGTRQSGGQADVLAYPDRHEQGRINLQGRGTQGGIAAGGSGENISDSICINDDNGGYGTGKESGKRPGQAKIPGSEYWLTEPNVGRVAHGVPSRVDRLKGLGNAIVPQIAEIIGRLILQTIVPSETGR